MQRRAIQTISKTVIEFVTIINITLGQFNVKTDKFVAMTRAKRHKKLCLAVRAEQKTHFNLHINAFLENGKWSLIAANFVGIHKRSKQVEGRKQHWLWRWWCLQGVSAAGEMSWNVQGTSISDVTWCIFAFRSNKLPARWPGRVNSGGGEVFTLCRRVLHWQW